MRQRIKLFTATLCLAFIALFMVPATVQAAPVDVLQKCNAESTVCQGTNQNSIFGVLKQVINLLITVAGIVSVIMIVVGGIKYSTSGGDAKAISSGKDTIVYSVIGLVVAIMSFAIVNFVLGKLFV